MFEEAALTRAPHEPPLSLAETVKTAPVDIERLSMKAHLWKEVQP